MQYAIRLPEGFDASLIRRRVEERSRLFDHLAGLAHKSFLFNEEDQLYAPFYIWQTQTAARSFLLDDLFRGVIDTFSRPRVRTWSVLATAYGNTGITPTYAVMESDAISPDDKLDRLMEREKKSQAGLLKKDGLYFHALALDADRWELVRYSLWKDSSSAIFTSADVVQSYTVLHVSEPEGPSVSVQAGESNRRTG